MFNPLDLMKNLSKMQSEMSAFQDRMKDIKVNGSAGGDLVRVEVNGLMQVTSLKLAPECVDPRDVPMLEELIVLAVNDAMLKAKDRVKDEMAKMTGLPLPPGFPGV